MAGEYVDTNSSPSQHADRYKLSVTDSFNRETNLSDAHKTIHLTVNEGINENFNLIWDGYQGFNFETYNIYRGKTKSNLQRIDQLQSTLNSYTDQPSSGKPLYYAVGVEKKGFKKNSANAVISVSNVVDINSNDNQLIYPNPAVSSFFVRTSEFSDSNVLVNIYTSQGRLVRQLQLIDEQRVSIDGLESGVYLIKLEGKKQTVTTKLIKR